MLEMCGVAAFRNKICFPNNMQNLQNHYYFLCELRTNSQN